MRLYNVNKLGKTDRVNRTLTEWAARTHQQPWLLLRHWPRTESGWAAGRLGRSSGAGVSASPRFQVSHIRHPRAKCIIHSVSRCPCAEDGTGRGHRAEMHLSGADGTVVGSSDGVMGFWSGWGALESYGIFWETQEFANCIQVHLKAKCFACGIEAVNLRFGFKIHVNVARPYQK